LVEFLFDRRRRLRNSRAGEPAVLEHVAGADRTVVDVDQFLPALEQEVGLPLGDHDVDDDTVFDDRPAVTFLWDVTPLDLGGTDNREGIHHALSSITD